MGMCINYGFKCNTKECAEKIVDEVARIAEKIEKTNPKAFHELYSPTHIMVCSHEDSECIELNFEPWQKASKQSYFLKKHDFQIKQNGKIKTYKGKGVAGNLIPDKVLAHMKRGKKTIQTEYGPMRVRKKGYDVKSVNERPLLGRGGLQTGGTPKTQYGGIKAHILACAVLEPAKNIADKWIIDDEGQYCGTGDSYDYSKLTDNLEEYTKVVASIGGMIREKGWSGEQIFGEGEKTRKRLELGT